MLVKNVTSGEPISAAWANSLVNNVNLKQGLSVANRSVEFTKARGGLQFANDAAWQIRITQDRKVTINAGQIYINGLLVSPEDAKHSYNQFCSCSNWETVCVQEIGDDGSLPIFYIDLKMPSQVTEENIDEVTATLKVKKSGELSDDESNEENDDNEEGTRSITIQLNDVVENEIKQKVSGSIYLDSAAAGFPRAKEGIIICEEENEIEDEQGNKTKVKENVIKLHVSIIGEDGIEVLDSLYEKSHEDVNPDAEKEENPARIFTIRGKRISFVGEDGITIEETKEMISEDEGGTLETPKEQTIYTIKGKAFSIIGKDGIFVYEEKVNSGERNEFTNFFVYGKKISLIAKDEMRLKIEHQEGKGEDYKAEKEWAQWTLQPKGISFIAGDGISIIHTDDLDNFVDCYEIISTASNISFVGCDKIRITEREGVDNTQKRKEIYVVNDHFSLIPTDNLRIEKQNGQCTISSPPLSLKRNWETNKIKSKFVTLKEGNNAKLNKKEIDTSSKWEDEYTISVKAISVIAGDGVNVELYEDNYSKCYTVSVGTIPSQIEFDPIYFVVEDGTVSLNEEALNEIVNEALEEISVEVTANGVVEHTARGTVSFTTPTQNLTLRSDTEFHT